MKLKSNFYIYVAAFSCQKVILNSAMDEIEPIEEEHHLLVDDMLSHLNCHSDSILPHDHKTDYADEGSVYNEKRETITQNGMTIDLDLLRARQIPVPSWLTEFTGIDKWPGMEPPYIPLDFIDFTKIPDFKPYPQGSCPLEGRLSCSFDCYKCIEPDDVYTCPNLSQTFDDGPTTSTIQLLNRFEETGQKSTFFNLGINVVSHPDIYQRMVRDEQLIGTHTWSHAFLPSLTNEQIIAQIQWSIWAMNATGHHIPKWFRPPYGAIDNRVRAITRQFGLQAVLWDYDTFDWMLLNEHNNQRTEQQILDDVGQWVSKAPKSGLILEHDGAAKTVQMGLKVSEIVGNEQLTVSKCVGGIDYIKTFGDDKKNSDQPPKKGGGGRRRRIIRRPRVQSPNKKREYKEYN